MTCNNYDQDITCEFECDTCIYDDCKQIKNNYKRRMRRIIKANKFSRMKNIILRHGYCPKIGYFKNMYAGQYTDFTHIKYRKNSTHQNDLKKTTSRKARKNNNLPNGKAYKKYVGGRYFM